MKKGILRGLMVVFSLFALIIQACTPATPKDLDTEHLLEGDATVTNYIEINVNTLEEMVAAEKNFLLFVGQVTCQACIAFKPIYTQFAKENNTKLYYIESSVELAETDLFDYQYTPSLVPFQKGVAKAVVDPNDDMKPFESASTLKDWVRLYFVLPQMLEVNAEELDQLIADQEDFVIYYYWKLCSDCSAMGKNLLNQYLIDHSDIKNFYFIEVHEYRNGGNDTDIWKAFAAKYGFDFYRGGKVPALQYRKAGAVHETIVYYNDTLEQIKDDQNNVTGYKILDSFYDDASFIGQTYSSYPELLTAITPFHNEKAKAFLDEYLPLVK